MSGQNRLLLENRLFATPGSFSLFFGPPTGSNFGVFERSLSESVRKKNRWSFLEGVTASFFFLQGVSATFQTE